MSSLINVVCDKSALLQPRFPVRPYMDESMPANWPHNHADIPIGPDGERSTEFKGSVFLLPTVSKEDADANYPGYHTCDVPSDIPYIRLVKTEDVEGSKQCVEWSGVQRETRE